MATKGKKKTPEVTEPVILTGTSEFEFPDGSKYCGDWMSKDGIKIRQGHGIFSTSYESYEGDWVNDVMIGQGKYIFSSGAIYEGQFENNLIEGLGTYTWNDGAIYKGSFLANKMHGEGEYRDSSSASFTGKFVNGFYDSGTSLIPIRSSQSRN